MDNSRVMERPKITNYENYRPFLRAMFLFKKERNRRFSFQALAKKIGVSSSLMKHVFAERKNIGVDQIPKVAQALDLDPFETDFLTIKVVRDVAKSDAVRGYFDMVLGKMNFQSSSGTKAFAETRSKAGEFLTGNWLASAIHQLAKFKTFNKDSSWIREKLVDGAEVSSAKVEETLDQLVATQLLVEEDQGWKAAPDVRGHAHPFQSKSFEVYREIVGKTYQVLGDPAKYRPCQFFVSTTAVDAATEEKIFQEFHQFRERVTALADQCKSPDRVLIISNNLFNVVRAPHGTS